MKLSRLSGRPFQKPTFTSIHLSIVIWNSYELNTISGRKDNPDIKVYISPRLLSGLVNFIHDLVIYHVIKSASFLIQSNLCSYFTLIKLCQSLSKTFQSSQFTPDIALTSMRTIINITYFQINIYCNMALSVTT